MQSTKSSNTAVRKQSKWLSITLHTHTQTDRHTHHFCHRFWLAYSASVSSTPMSTLINWESSICEGDICIAEAAGRSTSKIQCIHSISSPSPLSSSSDMHHSSAEPTASLPAWSPGSIAMIDYASSIGDKQQALFLQSRSIVSQEEIE